LLIAIGFLVRPEVLVLLPVICLSLLVIQFRRKGSWLKFTASAFVLLAVVAAGVAPFMLAAGRITTRIRLSASISPVLIAETYYPIEVSAPLRLLGRFIEAQHPVVAIFSLGWVVLLCLSLFLKKRPLRDRLVLCNATGACVMGFSCLLVSLVAMYHYTRTGAMSHRYLFLPAAVMAGAAGAGLVSLSRLAAGAPGKKLLVPCVTAGLVISLLIHARAPLHEKHIFMKEAGLWIAENASPGDRLLTASQRVSHYGRLPESRTILLAKPVIERRVLAGEPRAEIYRKFVRRRRGITLATFDSKNPAECESIQKAFLEYGFETARVFHRVEGEKVKEQIFIFRRKRK